MRLLGIWLFAAFTTATSTQHGYHKYAPNNLNVKAPSGSYRGIINGTAPNVRIFHGIPYAKPPTDELRWLPPQKLESNCDQTYDATRYPPSCPQDGSSIPEAFKRATPGYIISGPVSEDCLALSVWTPWEAEGLPVIMFMTGGGFYTGGVDINYQLPHHWVQRTQKHIVVTINYRLNIFGFPNAAGLDDQNLGILDQRMALEWVRDNIEAFGGDCMYCCPCSVRQLIFTASRIILWGQSAGGASVDFHNFAFYEDPIANGFFSMSGSAFLGISASDETNSNFTYVAQQVGCDYATNSTAELECMRAVPFQNISDVIARPPPNGLAFYPVADDKVIFSNYSERYAQGKISDRPAIFSTVEQEGNIVVPFPADGARINQTLSDQLTNALFLCPAAQTTELRRSAGLTTYRSLFAGDFANVSPLPWMNAYHNSDLTMLFGTHQDYTNGQGESTEYEFVTSHTYQDYVLAFMEDPEQGPEKLGWLPISDVASELLRFGRPGGEAVEKVSIQDVEAACAAGVSAPTFNAPRAI